MYYIPAILSTECRSRHTETTAEQNEGQPECQGEKQSQEEGQTADKTNFQGRGFKEWVSRDKVSSKMGKKTWFLAEWVNRKGF